MAKSSQQIDLSGARDLPAVKHKTVISGAIGNVLEWYDFGVYAFFATTIASQFFPSDSRTESLIAVFGVFAAGYLMRPLGAILFGHIGDRYGRKATLTISIVMMAVPTVALGLLPNVAQIGSAAALLLVACRLLQGISIGGEYTGSVVYLVEHAGTGGRGLLGTFAILGAGVGATLGSATAALIDASLTATQLAEWGWRIPFIAGGLSIGIAGFYLRRHMPDPPPMERAFHSPVIAAFRTQWRNILRIVGLNMMHAVGVFMVFIYIKTYLHEHVGIPLAVALTINTIAMFALMGFTATFGALSDRIGRKPVLIASSLAIMISAYPLFIAFNVPNPAVILAAQLAFAVMIGAQAGTAPTTMAELLPRTVRVSGTSIGYSICLSLFGGTTPLMAIYLIKIGGNDLVPAYYLMVAAAVTLAVVLSIKESANRALD